MTEQLLTGMLNLKTNTEIIIHRNYETLSSIFKLSVTPPDAEERKKNEEAEGQSNEASDKKPEPEKKPADNKSAPKGN